MSRRKLKIAGTGTECRSRSLAVVQGNTEGQPPVKNDPDQFDTNIQESESDDDGTDDSESGCLLLVNCSLCMMTCMK